jgi:hypothetical protein
VDEPQLGASRFRLSDQGTKARIVHLARHEGRIEGLLSPDQPLTGRDGVRLHLGKAALDGLHLVRCESELILELKKVRGPGAR